eukprot:3741062-Pyramimonas_sp.AAC.1
MSSASNTLPPIGEGYPLPFPGGVWTGSRILKEGPVSLKITPGGHPMLQMASKRAPNNARSLMMTSTMPPRRRGTGHKTVPGAFEYPSKSHRKKHNL